MRSPLFPYDKAVYDLIRALFPKAYYGSPDEIFSINAKKNKGKVVVPFIGVYRLPDFSINTEMFNDSFLRKGWPAKTPENKDIEFPGQRVQMRGLPVTLEYQLDIYATKRDVCDGVTSELMMYLKAHPYIVIEVPDTGGRLQEFSFDLQESVSDNTDITGFSESNRIYRLTLTADITEAVIYRITNLKKQINEVSLDLYDSSEIPIEEYDRIISGLKVSEKDSKDDKRD